MYSSLWEAHLQHLHQVLQVLHQHKLYAKFSKCQFRVPHVDYLGHVISREGVAAGPSKVQAIQQWTTPNSLTTLRGFLGLTGYYHRFVKNYASIAGPLTDLLEKNAFSWTDSAQQAFEALKTAMCSLPVLGLPNFFADFDVTTDASGSAEGAVLSQGDHPLAFFSKKLCPKMQLASAYDREMFAGC